MTLFPGGCPINTRKHFHKRRGGKPARGKKVKINRLPPSGKVCLGRARGRNNITAGEERGSKTKLLSDNGPIGSAAITAGGTIFVITDQEKTGETDLCLGTLSLCPRM